MVQKCGEQDLYNTFLQPYRYLSKGLFLIIESCIDVCTLDVLHRNNYTLYPVDYNQHQCRGQECLDVDSDNYNHRLDKSKINVSGNGKRLLEIKLKRIIAVSFGASTAVRPGPRKCMIKIRQDTDLLNYLRHILPRDQHLEVMPRMELKSWKLLRNEYLDSSESSETNLHEESSDESNIISLQKLQDVPCQLLDQLKDELNNYSEKELPLNEDLRNTFAEIFG
ncbi:unnamed protein product [Rhizophagus irregularis]|nr:unnamed protein product [Rhizophagus irregularis]